MAAAIPGPLFAVLGLVATVCLGLLALLGWVLWRGGFCGPLAGLRLTLLLAAFAAAHGGVWMLAVPPWQGPDEFAHYAYSALLAARVAPAARDPVALTARARLEQVVTAAMDARGFTRTVSWYANPGGPAADFVDRPGYGGSSLFLEVRQPPLYYQAAAVVLRTAAPDPLAIPPDIGLYLVRVLSVLWSILGVLAAWALTRLLAPGPAFRRLPLLVPLLVALLPMRTFVDVLTNNDVLAELAVALLALAVAALLVAAGRPLWQFVACLPLVPLCAALCLAAKPTTTAPAVLVLAVGGPLAALALRTPRRFGRGRAAFRLAWAAAVLVALGAAVLWVGGFDRQSTAATWFLDYGEHAPRVAVAAAPAGAYALAVPASRTVYQRVDLPAAPPVAAPYTLTFGIWVRPACAPACGHALARLESAQLGPSPPPAAFPVTATLAPGWQQLRATAVITPGTPFVVCALVADASLQAQAPVLATAWAPGAAGPAPALRDPQLAVPGAQLQRGSLLAQALALFPSAFAAPLIADTLANPQPFDKGAVVQTYLENQYVSFWGWFGWLTLPLQLPPLLSLLPGLLSLLGLLGWLRAWYQRPRPPAAPLVFAGLVLLALLAIVAADLARQMMQWAMYALQDFPQGRYLFVLLAPLAWLALAGGRAWLPVRLAPAWPLAGLILLAGFDFYALLVLVLPYYYGRF